MTKIGATRRQSVLVEEFFGVWVHKIRVGVLHRRGDYTRFVFDRGYWSDPDRPVLGLRFEDRPGQELASALRLPPWFSNLLPEGRLREWIAAERSVSVQREMELLARVGHDLPGAVIVGRISEPDQEIPDFPTLEAFSRGQGDDLPGRPDWRFSLAGVGLKFSMLRQGDRLTLPSGGATGDWIVKLPDAIHPAVPRNEYVTMELARAAGVRVPETALLRRAELPELPDAAWAMGEEEAFAVRRFDRGPGSTRIHMEDLAQVRGFYPEDKYKGNFETLANLIYRGRDIDGLREFARRLTFCVLVGNGDAHLKNWSLIYPDRRIAQLSPAYDLVATSVYRRPIDGPEDLGLKFGGSRRFEDVTLSTFQRLAERVGATDACLPEVVVETTSKVIGAWPRTAVWLDGLPQLRDALDARITEFARRLSSRGR